MPKLKLSVVLCVFSHVIKQFLTCEKFYCTIPGNQTYQFQRHEGKMPQNLPHLQQICNRSIALNINSIACVCCRLADYFRKNTYE